MKRLLIIGAGTAGTMMVNRLSKKLEAGEWQITVVDQHATHYYQPGFLFVPFGTYSPEQVMKPKTKFLPKSVEFVQKAVEHIDTDRNTIVLADGASISLQTTSFGAQRCGTT